MKSTISFYLNLIFSSMKQGQLSGIIKYAWEKKTDKLRKKRFQQYVQQAINPQQALEQIFLKKTAPSNIFYDLEKHLDNFIKIKKSQKWPSVENPYLVEYGLTRTLCRFLFSLCYYSKPEVVIETGVANGFSSAYFLLALNEVKKGKLISVDGIFLPWQTKEKIGQAIPEKLTNQQTLLIGNALKEIVKLLNEFKQIDIFFHDDDHTYNHMTKEFNIVWPHIKKGGFLLSDDVAMNDAFLDFADKINSKPIIISKEDGSFFGIIKK